MSAIWWKSVEVSFLPVFVESKLFVVIQETRIGSIAVRLWKQLTEISKSVLMALHEKHVNLYSVVEINDVNEIRTLTSVGFKIKLLDQPIVVVVFNDYNAIISESFCQIFSGKFQWNAWIAQFTYQISMAHGFSSFVSDRQIFTFMPVCDDRGNYASKKRNNG